MKNIVLLIGTILSFALISCSKPPHFLLLNSSGRDVFVETVTGQKVAITSGQWIELEFSPALKILQDGKLLGYAWRYPSPASEFMEYGKPTERFAVSLEPDGAIYARKIMYGKPSAFIPDQPSGFPLTPL